MLINALLADNETVEIDGAGAGTSEVVAEPVAVDGVEEPVVVDAPQPAAFDPAELQTRLDASEVRTAQLEQLIGALLQGDPNAAALDGGQGFNGGMIDPSQLDPFADDFGQQFAAVTAHNNQVLLSQIGQMFQQFTQPFERQREQETIQHGESNLGDMLADDIARNGEFHPTPEVDQRARTMARERANQIYMDLANRYGGHDAVMASGFGPRVAEQAMASAAREVRELFGLIGTSAVQVETNRLATLAGAHGELGVGTGGVQGPGQFKDTRSVTEFYAGNARSLTA